MGEFYFSDVHPIKNYFRGCKSLVFIRVTRLGEFSPVELLFSLLIKKYSQTVRAIFFNGNFIVVNLTTYGLGYILGIFFTKASRHPGLYLLQSTQ
jgi:hypothetical protein